jgi:adenylate cyclase
MKKLQGLILLLLFVTPLLYQPVFYQVLKLRTFDRFVVTPKESGNFAVLSITEEDIDQEGGYPLPRQRLAKIHDNLLSRGATGVGWVIGFPHADRLGGDEKFAKALSHSSSVLALFENDNGKYPDTVGTVVRGDGAGGYTAKGTVQNIDVLKNTEWTEQGIASAPVEIDNLIRRIPLLYRTPEGWLASFGTQVLKVMADSKTYIINTNENGIQEIVVQGLPPVKVDSMGRKWVSWVVPRETSLAEMDVEGRFVFVGVTAKGVMPQLATPVGLLEPHYIQAALAESMLIQNSPYIPDYALAVEVGIYVVSVSLVWLLVSGLGITWGVLSFALILTVTAYAGVQFVEKGVLIDVTWALVTQMLAAGVAYYLNFRTQYRLRQQIKKQFEHYLDPRQVKQLQENPELLKLGGETRYATFLFTDVRGFTSLSETLPPEQVTYIMNKALTAQQKAVQKYGGMVDKYIGDAMMAIFNAPLDQPKHENRGVECALEIIENMSLLNKELNEEGLPEIAIGIGVNSGRAVIGNMGSESRFDYTAIGDAVNTAARLESATKEQKVDLLVGESTTTACSFNLEFVDEIYVKGKEKGLKVYTFKNRQYNRPT